MSVDPSASPQEPSNPADLVERLRESEERYRSLLEHLPVVVYVDKAEGKGAEYVTPNVEQVLGYPAQAYIDRPTLWNETLYDGDRERIIPLWRAAWNAGIPYEAEYRFVRPDGSLAWIRDTAYATREADGSIVWQGVMLDISAEKGTERELRTSEERYRTLVEQLPWVVYVVANELDPVILYTSPNVAGLTGWSASDWVDGHVRWPDVIHPDDREAAWEAWAQAFETGGSSDLEFRMLRPDGSKVWIRDSCVPVRTGADGIAFWQGVMMDVSEEKRINEELRDSERRYRALVEQLPAVVYVVSDELESSTLYVSPGIEELAGVKGFKYVGLGEPWMDLIHPDDREAVLATAAACLPEGDSFSAEYRIVRPDGEVLWIRDTASLIPDEDGASRFWQGVLMDVTQAHKAREDLLASETRHKTLVEQLPAVVYEMGVDDERRTYFVSPHVEHVLGYSRHEWLDQSDIWIELLHPDDRETELDAHDRHIASGEPWDREYRLIASDGREVWVRDRASLLRGADGEPTAWLGVMLDITRQKQLEDELRTANDDLELRVLTRTAQLEEANELMGLEIAERRRAENELKAAEERYRHLLENLPAVVYRWQPRPSDDGKEYWYTSPRIEDVLGYTADEWHEGWGLWRQRVHPHDREAVNEHSLRSEQTGEPFEMEYRLFAKDGRVVWVFDRATLMMRNAAGEPLVFQGVILDVTGKKEAERRATEAEERFRALTERGPVIAYAYTLEPIDPPRVKVEYVSPQMGTILGYPLSRWVDDPEVWMEMTHPDDRRMLTDEIGGAWVSGEPWDLVYRMIAADGRIVWLNDRGLCIERDEKGRPRRFLGGIVDVSESAEEMEAMRRSFRALSYLVEGIPAITWTESVDTEGRSRFLYISPQSLEVLGFTSRELMEEPGHFERMVHPDDKARVVARVPDAQAVWDQVYRVRCRDGSVRWLHGRARRITPPEVAPAIWQGVTVDVTNSVERGETSEPPLYESTESSST